MIKHSDAEAFDSMVKRFWRFVKKSAGCWTWLGYVDRDGYGTLGARLFGKQSVWRAPRLAWLIHHGEMPSLHVLHKCDNPSCVRPGHLFIGDNTDNVRDAWKKGRNHFQVNGNPSQKLTDIQVWHVRRLALALPQSALGRLVRISPAQVSRIVNRVQRAG